MVLGTVLSLLPRLEVGAFPCWFMTFANLLVSWFTANQSVAFHPYLLDCRPGKSPSGPNPP
jgi:hypothetical protein